MIDITYTRTTDEKTSKLMTQVCYHLKSREYTSEEKAATN